ncbi:hypothetical protein RKD18_005580 [Streptomyces phaeoluteigriseus]
MDDVEEVVQEVGGGAAVAAEADHAVGREVLAVLGDEVEQAGAAGTGGAGEADGTAAGEQPDELLALLLAAEEGLFRLGGSGRSRRLGRVVGLGAVLRAALGGASGPLGGRGEFDLAAVDRVDGEDMLAGDDSHGAGESRRVLSEVGCEGIPGRTRARRVAVGLTAVLLGSPVRRVHR